MCHLRGRFGATAAAHTRPTLEAAPQPRIMWVISTCCMALEASSAAQVLRNLHFQSMHIIRADPSNPCFKCPYLLRCL